ncbi:UNVERIFIED_CONTAM: S-adenosylmethionine decarboxylase proenzyme 4 [Sesamum latifolium]|uniref:S-adenosylmethionine decarboxylase proenzyme 4 n=1 Tax=Sesamum latifolium TaxID=2727402 RepID=A0AAW2VXX5_9LAMI
MIRPPERASGDWISSRCGAVHCKYFDSYVLSESSLFVYPTKVIIKTCGPLSCSNPSVHWWTMVLRWASLYVGASIMNSKSCYKWHVFTACDEGCTVSTVDMHAGDLYTVEICMTELDRVLAKKFFRRFNDGKTGDSAGREMTEVTGIRGINTNALICDYAFDPCGYSMNGIDENRYSTVHVTPEDGFSYASFECVGSIYDDKEEILDVLKKVVKIFRPGALSVSMTCATGHQVWRGMSKAIEPLGLRLRSFAADEFPNAGNVIFQSFIARRK